MYGVDLDLGAVGNTSLRLRSTSLCMVASIRLGCGYLQGEWLDGRRDGQGILWEKVPGSDL